ncbi:hypothetical protein K503DRAFT_860162 [Rhizopogon vinicolor AM-OR11-026]|uniref:Uncharacterized protein n=1 Tax=Rhizopogon vinicolor AM-OR11-026 TaxID=1314800 RepID=A0A1B7MJI9_9AGAM|nr:hypothetical protein K503DRAFT_860162 [Rhizopogon vinicolor AM-OR11-026]
MSSKKSGSKKLAKAKVPDRNLRVTDFFTRRPAQSPTSSSQLGSVALATHSRHSNSSKASLKSDKSSIETVSNNTQPTSTPILSLSRTSSSSGSATLLSPPPTASRSRSPTCLTQPGPTSMTAFSSRTTRSHVYTTVARASQKRPRSPDHSLGASHLLTASSPAKSRSPNKRKKKFDSDSETERPDTVIHVQKPGSPLKSSSLAPPPIGPQTPASCKHIIYSSQSDEMELVIPVPDTRSLVQVKEQVHTWRQNTLASPSSSANGHSPNTTVPLANSEYLDGLRSCSSTSLTSAFPETPIQPSASLPSPPDTEAAPPLPVTPIESDNERKATQLIASIKVQALESPLSDEEEHYTFRELDDSTDDDFEDITVLPDRKGKGKSPLLAVPSSVDDLFGSPLSSIPSSTHKPSTSYNLRNHNCSPSASPTRPAVNTRKASKTTMHTRSGRTSKPALPLNLPRVLANNAAISAKHKKSNNPLEALLREKRAAEKRGNGSAAFRRAEDASRARVSFDVEPEYMGLIDEGAAWQAIQEHAQRQSSSPILEPLDDIVLGERETHILGSEAGAKITQILVSDKNRKPMKEKVLGVPLWHGGADDDRMNVDGEHDVSFGDASNHPTLALLQHLSGIGATNQLALILSSGVLGVLDLEEKSTVISPLFALASRPSRLSDAARHALHSLWSAASPTSKSLLLFSDIATALVTLGARRQVVQDLHWAVRADVRPLDITHEDRLRVASGVVKLVEVAGRTENLVAEDMPDILLSLVLIGLDKTTSNDLRVNVNSALDSICQTIDTRTHTSIHRRLLSYATTLTPANKAHLVSFFSSGSGRTRHIAQWLAYALLLPQSTPSDELPPLDPLILLLSPTAGSDELFDVTSPTADFEDLRHYFDILSVALANIEPYVNEESSLSLSRQSSMMDDSPRKSQKPLVPLELLLQVLEVTQGRIVDTRAAHLDRSRTKAAMHRLQMRVHYQRQAFKASRGRTMPTIQHYFGPK